MNARLLLLLGCAALSAATGCSGRDDRRGDGAAKGGQIQRVRIPPEYKVVESLLYTTPGDTPGEKLRRRLGPEGAAGATLAVAGGGGEPIHTLVGNFDWSVSPAVSGGKVRVLIPSITSAGVAVGVDGRVVWEHGEDGRDVLSPEIDLGPPGPTPDRDRPGRRLTVHVRGTGLHGGGGVGDVLILRRAVPAATQAAAARAVTTTTVQVRVLDVRTATTAPAGR